MVDEARIGALHDVFGEVLVRVLAHALHNAI